MEITDIVHTKELVPPVRHHSPDPIRPFLPKSLRRTLGQLRSVAVQSPALVLLEIRHCMGLARFV